METLQTKFIEGTNEQYSIREDGVVIRHFKKKRVKGMIFGKIYEDVLVPYKKFLNNKCLYATINCNDMTVHFTKNGLLAKYFGYIFCPNCEQKKEAAKKIRICSTCVKDKEKKYHAQWKSLNSERFRESYLKSYHKNKSKYAEKQRHIQKKHKTIISRHYAASKLNISISDLTDEIYESFKKTLLLKREVSKEFNIPVNQIR